MELSCSLRLSAGPARQTRSAWFSASSVVTRPRSGYMPKRASRRLVIQSQLDLTRPCSINPCASSCEAVLPNKRLLQSRETSGSRTSLAVTTLAAQQKQIR